MKRRLAIICLLAFMFIFTGCGKKDNTNNKSYTLMVYMIGSDLEAGGGAATSDMAEMAANKIDFDKTNVIVYTGGSPKWHSDISSDENAVYILKESGFEKIETYEMSSMGNPENLSTFLNYVYDNYKTDEYSLILWDHGNGPVMGYGLDKKFDNDALTLPELESALEASPFGKENKLEFIGFDACLMASAELASTVDDYAKYLIASQETEPSFGWNYEFIKDCSSSSTEDLVKTILGAYLSYSEEYFAQNKFFSSDVTLAAINLSYANELETAIDDLFAKASENVSGGFIELAGARVNARCFGRATTGSEYDLVDIMDLMTAMEEKYPDETKAVEDILGNMVVDSKSNTTSNCGLSLYYPYFNKNYYKASWKKEYGELGVLPNYKRYLEQYEQVWLGTDMTSFFNEELEPEADASGQYILSLSEEQAKRVGHAAYNIFRKEGENAYTLVYYSDDVTTDGNDLIANFDGKVIYWSDDYEIQKQIPLMKNTGTIDNISYYSIFPQIKNVQTSKNETCEMQIAVDTESEAVTIKGVYSLDESKELETGKREEINIDDWHAFDFYNFTRYLTRNRNNKILNYWSWTPNNDIIYRTLVIKDGVNFTYEKMYDDGYEYYLSFSIYDVQGNDYQSELMPIFLEEAPAKVRDPYEEMEWADGDKSLISNEGNVEIYLCKNEDTYSLEVVNNNDFEVWLTVNRPMVNETYFCNHSGSTITVPAGKTEEWEMSNLTEMLSYGEIENVESISLNIEQKNMSDWGQMFKPKNIKVNIASSIGKVSYYNPSNSQKNIYLPYTDEIVERQVIVDNDKVKVTLIGCGKTSEYSSYLTGVLRIENKQDCTIPVVVSGVCINGTYMDPSSTSITMSGKGTCYEFFSVGEFEDSQITGIEDLSILLLTDYSEKTSMNAGYVGGNWYDVDVTSASNVVKKPNSGKLVYSDENIELYFLRRDEYRFSEEGYPSSYLWKVYVVNKTDKDISVGSSNLTVNGESKDGFFSNVLYVKVGAGMNTYGQIYFDNSSNSERPELTFNLDIKSLGGDYHWYTTEDTITFN